jgi:epsilon-lactone hydrolase
VSPDDISDRDKAEVAAMRAMIAPTGLVPEFPPNLLKARAGHEGLARLFPVLAGTVCTSLNLGGVKAEEIVPPNFSGSGTILYFHGWGYALGSIESHRHLVAQLAAASEARAYCLDYRLAPEHPFPAAIEDGVRAYQALLASGIFAHEIVIAGDSSGGGLALSVALALKAAEMPQPAGLFLMSPWVDLSLSGVSHERNAVTDFMCNRAELHHWARLYAGDDCATNQLASPILADLNGLAPMLIHAGSEEILLSDSIALAQKVRLVGQVDFYQGENMPHTWHYLWPFVSAARQAIAQAGIWINKRLQSS